MKTLIEKADQNTSDLLNSVRQEYHPELLSAEFLVLFRYPAAKSKGKTVLASTKKATPEIQGLAGSDFDYVLTISKDDWLVMSHRQRQALLDHELCHCIGEEDELTGEMKWRLQGHDIEEFAPVLKRWGAWTDDIIKVVETLQQLDLFADPKAFELAEKL